MAKFFYASFIACAICVSGVNAAEHHYFDHNGSVMEIDFSKGLITYASPKASIKSLVKPGTILFSGNIDLNGAVSGVSYLFKKGCDPVPYEVSGRYEATDRSYRLNGEAPVRSKSGCEVTGYSTDNSNARLEFFPLDANSLSEAVEQIKYIEQVYESESGPSDTH